MSMTMKSGVPDEMPGNTAKDKLALLEKQEEIRERLKNEEKERLAKIERINRAANIEQQRDLAALRARNIDFSQNPTSVNEQVHKILGKLPSVPLEDDGLGSVYYEKETGIGYTRKRFKFKRNSDSYKVFPEMYEHINSPVTKERITELLNYIGNGYYERANALAKVIRRSTGLSADKVVLNSGSLTLIGKKLEKPPK